MEALKDDTQPDGIRGRFGDHDRFEEW